MKKFAFRSKVIEHIFIIIRRIKLGNSKKEKSQTISIFDLLFVIAKRWKLIFFTSLGAAVFIFLFAAGSIILNGKTIFGATIEYLPNFYKPVVKVLFQQEKNSISSMLGGGSDLLSLMGGAMSSSNNESNMAEELLYRNMLLDQLIKEFDVYDKYQLINSTRPRQQARMILKESFTTEFDASNSTMQITFKDTDPKFAELILLRAVSLLEKQYKAVSRERTTETISFLNDSIVKAEVEMYEKLDELTQFQKDHNIIDPLKQLELKSEAIGIIENEIIQKRLKADEIASYKGYSDPQAKQTRKEIFQLEKSLKMQIEGVGLKSKYNIPISDLIEIGPEYNKLEQELEGLTQLYRSLRAQQYATELEMSNSASTFQIIETPGFYAGLAENENPSELPIKAGPSRGKLCILFTFAIFFLSIFAAFVLEFFDRIKEDPEEYEKLTAIKNELPKLTFLKGKTKK